MQILRAQDCLRPPGRRVKHVRKRIHLLSPKHKDQHPLVPSKTARPDFSVVAVTLSKDHPSQMSWEVSATSVPIAGMPQTLGCTDTYILAEDIFFHYPQSALLLGFILLRDIATPEMKTTMTIREPSLLQPSARNVHPPILMAPLVK